MPKGESREIASSQLGRVLSFFSRVEAKASFLFALNIGLLTVMALNLSLPDLRIWFVVIPGVVALGLVIASLYFVYRCMFPHLEGGSDSLVYFREIAKRTEASYINEFLKQDENQHVRDLLGQVWRNSEILKIKFEAIKTAFLLTAGALIPWLLFLIATGYIHSQAPIIR